MTSWLDHLSRNGPMETKINHGIHATFKQGWLPNDRTGLTFIVHASHLLGAFHPEMRCPGAAFTKIYIAGDRFFSVSFFCGPSRFHTCMYVYTYSKLPIDRPRIDRVAASPCRFFTRRDVSRLLTDDFNTRHNVFRVLFDDLNTWRDIFLVLFNDSNTRSDDFWVSFDVHAARYFCGWTVS
jgi:hypothetical protein